MGGADKDVGMEDFETVITTVTEVIANANPKPLRSRKISNMTLDANQIANQVRYRIAYLKDITEALTMVENRETDAAYTPTPEFNKFMKQIISLILNLRQIELIFKRKWGQDVITTFQTAAREVFTTLKVLQTQEAAKQRIAFHETTGVKYSPTDNKSVLQLIHLVNNLFTNHEDLHPWDDTMQSLPDMILGIQVMPPLPENIPKDVKPMGNFVSGGVLVDPLMEDLRKRTKKLVEGNSGTVVRSEPIGDLGDSKVGSNRKNQDYNFMRPPTGGYRTSSGLKTSKLEMPHGWYDVKTPVRLQEGQGFLDYFKKNHLSNYIKKFDGTSKCGITLTDVWDKFREDVHKVPEAQCKFQTKMHILLEFVLDKDAKKLVAPWQSNAERGYPTAWNLLLKKYGINRLLREDLEDKLRALRPESTEAEEQYKYLNKVDKYHEMIVNCNVPEDEVSCLAISLIQRKIRFDVWSTVKVYLKIDNTNDQVWYLDDPFTNFRLLVDNIMSVMKEIEHHEKLANEALVSDHMAITQGDSDIETEEGEFSGFTPKPSSKKFNPRNKPRDLETKDAKPKQHPPRCTCKICGSHKHTTENCLITDPLLRFKMLKDRDTCVNCLDPDCPANPCPEEMQCHKCKGSNYKKHASLTCRVDTFKSNSESSSKPAIKRQGSGKGGGDYKPPTKKSAKVEGSYAAKEVPEQMDTQGSEEEGSSPVFQSSEEILNELNRAKETIAELQKIQREKRERSPT